MLNEDVPIVSFMKNYFIKEENTFFVFRHFFGCGGSLDDGMLEIQTVNIFTISCFSFPDINYMIVTYVYMI